MFNPIRVGDEIRVEFRTFSQFTGEMLLREFDVFTVTADEHGDLHAGDVCFFREAHDDFSPVDYTHQLYVIQSAKQDTELEELRGKLDRERDGRKLMKNDLQQLAGFLVLANYVDFDVSPCQVAMKVIKKLEFERDGMAQSLTDLANFLRDAGYGYMDPLTGTCGLASDVVKQLEEQKATQSKFAEGCLLRSGDRAEVIRDCVHHITTTNLLTITPGNFRTDLLNILKRKIPRSES